MWLEVQVLSRTFESFVRKEKKKERVGKTRDKCKPLSNSSFLANARLEQGYAVRNNNDSIKPFFLGRVSINGAVSKTHTYLKFVTARPPNPKNKKSGSDDLFVIVCGWGHNY